MNWDDLRVFLAVARQGTLSGAARALGLTQPTVGRRLTAMEESSGARLLQKTPGLYVLTPVGEAILGNAERAEAEMLAAERTISGKDVRLEGEVRLTTVDTLTARIVTPTLARLQARHPDIVVELVPDTRSLSLSKREADIALRMARFKSHEIIARKVGQMALALYASKDWEEPKKAEDVGLITVLDDQVHLPEAKWLKEAYPKAKLAFRSNSREVQVWAAKSGVGIGALARYRADAEPDLVRVRPDMPDLVRDIWLGVHGDMRQMPRVRAVMDELLRSLREHAQDLNPAPA